MKSRESGPRNFLEKERMRAEISRQVSDYLRSGGRIEELGSGSQHHVSARVNRWPAGADLLGLDNNDAA